MLGKPYKLITTIDLNRYYLLRHENKDYLAIESFYKVNGKGQVKEIQQGLKLLELNEPILALLLEMATTKAINKDGDEMLYEPFNFDNLDNLLKRVEQKAIDEGVVDKLRYELFLESDQTNSNATIQELVYQGYKRLYSVPVDGLFSFARETALVKVTDFGSVNIHKIVTIGKTDPYLTIGDLSTFVLTFTLARQILKEIQKLDEKRTK